MGRKNELSSEKLQVMCNLLGTWRGICTYELQIPYTDLTSVQQMAHFTDPSNIDNKKILFSTPVFPRA